MVVRIYTTGGRLSPSAIALGVILLAIGGAVILSSLALLLVLGVGAAAIGAGALLVRRLTGRPVENDPGRRVRTGLDPSLEVFPSEVREDARRSAPSALPPSSNDG